MTRRKFIVYRKAEALAFWIHWIRFLLFLENNLILGTELPNDVSKLTELTKLSVSGNRFGGDLPNGISGLIGLTKLDMGGHSLTGPLPLTMSLLTNMLVLDMHGNGLDGLPTGWKLPNAVKVNLYDNLLGGAIPAAFTDMTDLEELNLFNNSLTSGLGNLPWGTQLTQVVAYDNALADATDALAVAGAVNLVTLNLRENALTGSLPPQWTDLTEIRSLDMGFNNIGGQLPAAWSGLTTLELLKLGDNSITGGLPLQFSTLTDLKVFDVSANILTGTLSPQFSTLAFNGGGIFQFSVYQNDLTGTLPVFLKDVPSRDVCTLPRPVC